MKNFLDYASAKYYAGEPIISDAEFDRLAEEFGYESVGARVDPAKAIRHQYQMYSLKKFYPGDKLPDLPDKIETPKLDGAAVSLLYAQGTLVLALTRGDGKAGQDITNKMNYLVPKFIPTDWSGQITGEVVAPKTIPNSRNYAAGALNLKDLDEFAGRELDFVAYGVQPLNLETTFLQDMEWLENIGFKSVYGNDMEKYPQDGVVFRCNDNSTFDRLGFTSNHPRGAYAFKTRAEGVHTTLKDVTWQVGRTGVVSPVAILEPVLVGDATVSRATLHNMKYIEELGLEIGCEVEIIRSGEIIPRVVRRI